MDYETKYVLIIGVLLICVSAITAGYIGYKFGENKIVCIKTETNCEVKIVPQVTERIQYIEKDCPNSAADIIKQARDLNALRYALNSTT